MLLIVCPKIHTNVYANKNIDCYCLLITFLLLQYGHIISFIFNTSYRFLYIYICIVKLFKVIYTYISLYEVIFLNKKQKISLNVDSELWHKFRIKTVQEQKTATEILEGFIRKYINR